MYFLVHASHCRGRLEVWLVLFHFYWYTGKMNTRYLEFISTLFNLKITIQIFTKVRNTKCAHKLHSAHENIVVLCYVLHLLDRSQSGGGGDFVFFLSSLTAESNKPHITPHLLPATSLEIRNSRGWISPTGQSKWNQKGAALDNWSLLLQLQHQYFPQ